MIITMCRHDSRFTMAWILDCRSLFQFSTFLFLLLCVSITQATQCDDEGWDLHHSGHCYKTYQEKKLSWYDARKTCKAEDADLAVIADVQDKPYLVAQMGKVYQSWIGLSDLAGDVYKWVDGTTPSGLDWSEEKTNNEEITRCAALAVRDSGMLVRQNCFARLPFICEKIQGSSSSVTVPPTTTDEGCPEKFYGPQGTSRCFYVGGKTEKDGKTFKEAGRACGKLMSKSRLASIHSELDEDAILALLADASKPAWIGLILHTKRRRFEWTDNEGLKYIKFDGQSMKKNLGQCMNIEVRPKTVGMWGMSSCSDKLAYICEHSKDNSPPHQALPIPNACKDGYQPFRKSCYRYISTPQTWPKSESTCNQDGGHLLSIHDEFEKSFSDILLRSEAQGSDVWLGLSDIGSRKNTFTWSDDSPVFKEYWDGLNSRRSNYKCTAVKPNTKWETVNCNAKLPSVCEIDKDPSPKPSVPGMCPGLGWRQHGDFCYLVEGETLTSFSDASHKCQSNYLGAELATVHSDNDADAISLFVSLSDVDTWIGLRYIDHQFTWLDKSKVDYTRWAPDYPTSVEASQCVVARGIDGKWMNTDCNSKHSLICKLKQVPLYRNTASPPAHTVPFTSTTITDAQPLTYSPTTAKTKGTRSTTRAADTPTTKSTTTPHSIMFSSITTPNNNIITDTTTDNIDNTVGKHNNITYTTGASKVTFYNNANNNSINLGTSATVNTPRKIDTTTSLTVTDTNVTVTTNIDTTFITEDTTGINITFNTPGSANINTSFDTTDTTSTDTTINITNTVNSTDSIDTKTIFNTIATNSNTFNTIDTNTNSNTNITNPTFTNSTTNTNYTWNTTSLTPTVITNTNSLTHNTHHTNNNSSQPTSISISIPSKTATTKSPSTPTASLAFVTVTPNQKQSTATGGSKHRTHNSYSSQVSGLQPGTIAGVTVGVCVFTAIIIIAVIIFVVKKRKTHRPENTANHSRPLEFNNEVYNLNDNTTKGDDDGGTIFTSVDLKA